MPDPVVFAAMALLALVIVWSGYQLKHRGRAEKGAYPGPLLNLHKLLALGTAAWLAVVLFGAGRPLTLTAMQTQLRAGVLMLAAVAVISGGVKSIPASIPQFVKVIHQLVPYLALAGGGYLLFGLLLS